MPSFERIAEPPVGVVASGVRAVAAAVGALEVAAVGRRSGSQWGRSNPTGLGVAARGRPSSAGPSGTPEGDTRAGLANRFVGTPRAEA
jgi:hypothetical protein